MSQLGGCERRWAKSETPGAQPHEIDTQGAIARMPPLSAAWDPQ